MQRNYHTHTVRCMHAKGADEDYVRTAIANGFTRIGFSDHSPWPFNGFVSGMRMHARELPGYVESIRALQERYRGQIEILIGLECEYFPEYLPWLQEQIAHYGLDYIICGHHFSPNEPDGVYNGSLTKPEELYAYRDGVLGALDSGLFAYIAHPDLFMRGYPAFDAHCEAVAQEIIQKAITTNTPLEYNLLGISHGIADGKPGYPCPDFWRMAGQLGATAIIGIDAHRPDAYADRAGFAKAEETLRVYGLRLVDEIEYKFK